MNVQNRTLFIADNLDILRGINSECIDLIYLDPPFNSKRNYKAPIGSPAEGAEFKDIWTDEDVKDEWHGQIASQHEELYQIIQASEATYDKSMKIYLTAMAIRLFEMKRILKPTGSIYLHCDPTASHYLKLIMDDVFGKENFQNEIVWNYRWASNVKVRFARKHDILYFYSKSDKWCFNMNDVREPYTEEQLKGYKQDEKGHYTISKGKKYYANPHGQTPSSVFNIGIISRSAKERTGYPTQKPLKLLERIISASSNEDDMVLDPFCGCATACVAAEKLNRQWIGIDISPSAEDITKFRLVQQEEETKGVGADYLKEKEKGQLVMFDPISDVTVTSDAPIRTDNTEEIAIQQKLPLYHIHKPELFGKQRGRCNGCQYELPYRILSIDHIIPRSKGIDNRIENLQLLCPSCNSTKGTGTHAELITKLKANNIIQSTK